ncbi:unnamed protein product [marine sediment metagenome]|uniref:Uncharacterized protein n=1 Tax=marine sediment metagenome TaxID=412755 RepID=X1E0M2_9ZZZZ
MACKLTKLEIRVIKLVHHDGCGLSHREAAAGLGISRQRVDAIINQVESKVPSLFPILTRMQKQVADLLYDGATQLTIAMHLELKAHRIARIVQQLHRKGYDFTSRKKCIGYKDWMDSQIVEKF